MGRRVPGNRARRNEALRRRRVHREEKQRSRARGSTGLRRQKAGNGRNDRSEPAHEAPDIGGRPAASITKKVMIGRARGRQKDLKFHQHTSPLPPSLGSAFYVKEPPVYNAVGSDSTVTSKASKSDNPSDPSPSSPSTPWPIATSGPATGPVGPSPSTSW
ncbi:hypothetical protein AAFF_G00112170 [Aldrovandia affinis]|uniref:Uncharacterized protein n=1 Tax=Aldrovandia affinis TaxID=143900 RepID=A0AAD7RTG6_9TELE|nr:hypothetical protein AAFF_G00112170 [Aldrovandia affinis]